MESIGNVYFKKDAFLTLLLYEIVFENKLEKIRML